MDQALNQKIDAYIAENKEQLLQDIAALVAIDSVEGTPEEGAPFGAGPRAALDKTLELAAGMGLATRNCENYIGYAELAGADPEKYLATICHVDVVPVGNGWSQDPFKMQIRDGWMIGRGVADDKGPMVATLYALKFLKEEGVSLRYPIRALVGDNEETHMHDVDYYLANYPAPVFCFTPDAEFPVCNGEKDRAQELGEQFCKEHFPGHQALICTHPDGHNHSGNIHVHIVINSLRIYEVPLLPYMDRPADTREGCKHRCTNAAMEYFKSEVMEMCHREGLYQIDLLNGSKERITEREYWAAKKGQLALDKENAAREAAGQPTKPTKFETDKAKLRRTIRQALSQAGSFDEFSSLLLREGVTVKESRGRLSYLTPDRTKPITARKLGDDFDKAAVLVLLTQNAHRAAEQSKAILEYPAAVKKLSQGEKTTKTTPADNTLQRMVDREAKRAEGKGVGYDRWAAKHNLKQMAATVTAYQQYGFSSPEELDEACSAAYTAMRESLTELKQMEKTLNGKKELQRQVLAYSKTRPVRDGLKQQKNAKAKAAYRQKHESDFIIADAAARYFRENGISKLPSYKSLQAEIESLIKEKNSGYNDYRAKREEYRRLQTVKGNIDQILRRSEPQRRKEQSHER